MKLTFLGTAAAEGFPGLFCRCDHCCEARRLGGRNIRFRSAMLVNNDVLFDFGPDLVAAAQRWNLELAGIRTTLVTHNHEDHLLPANFELRMPPYCGSAILPVMDLFAPVDAIENIKMFWPDDEAVRSKYHVVGPFESFASNGYQFQSYRAIHGTEQMTCLFYSVDDGQKRVLYATDTGPFPEDTWAALEGQVFDAIVLEETMGTVTVYHRHTSIEAFFKMYERLQAQGILRSGGKMIATHFSHHANPAYQGLVDIFEPRGVQVAYDGLEVIV